MRLTTSARSLVGKRAGNSAEARRKRARGRVRSLRMTFVRTSVRERKIPVVDQDIVTAAGLPHQPGESAVGPLLAEPYDDLLARLIERDDLGRRARHHLEDVEPVLCGDQPAHLPGREREDDLRERRREVLARELPLEAAGGGAGIARQPAGELREVGAAGELTQGALSRAAVLGQDLSQPDPLRPGELAAMRLVIGRDLPRGRLLLQVGREEGVDGPAARDGGGAVSHQPAVDREAGQQLLVEELVEELRQDVARQHGLAVAGGPLHIVLEAAVADLLRPDARYQV